MTWSDKSKVMVVLPPPGDAGRDVILKKICGMGEGVYLRRMLQAAFVGEPMISLHEAATPAAVKLFVKSNSGAVGFLRKGDVDASVRAVMSLE